MSASGGGTSLPRFIERRFSSRRARQPSASRWSVRLQRSVELFADDAKDNAKPI